MSFPEEWGPADNLTRRETLDIDIDHVAQELIVAGCVWWKNEKEHRTMGKVGLCFYIPLSDETRKVAVAVKRIQAFMGRNCPFPTDELVPEGARMLMVRLDDTLELVG